MFTNCSQLSQRGTFLSHTRFVAPDPDVAGEVYGGIHVRVGTLDRFGEVIELTYSVLGELGEAFLCNVAPGEEVIILAMASSGLRRVYGFKALSGHRRTGWLPECLGDVGLLPGQSTRAGHADR